MGAYSGFVHKLESVSLEGSHLGFCNGNYNAFIMAFIAKEGRV
jgi:hypothetical protein